MSQKYANDKLGTRMKGYEGTTQIRLLRRTPVILRLDGRAFHTWTRCLKDMDDLTKSPFSGLMSDFMASTTQTLIKGIQNAVFAYSQSDEISILLRDWDKHETEQWFDGNIQKITSISAAIASTAFSEHLSSYYGAKSVQFDARVFNLPKEEVCNYFIWRQLDASRNSVQMLARHYFSHKELHQKNNSQIQDMLMLQKGVNWNDIRTWQKRGFCVGKNLFVDREIPVFTQDRHYVETNLSVPELEENIVVPESPL